MSVVTEGDTVEDMSKAEYMAFLAEGTRTGKLATVCADGRPHVVPIWFVVDGETLFFNTWHTTVKAANIRRDGRACLTVDHQAPPYHFVMVQGRAEIVDTTPEEQRHWATQIGARYMGADQAEAFGKRNAVPGELVVRMSIDHVVAHKNMTD